MRLNFLIFFSFVFLHTTNTGCKKAVEQKKQDALVEAMVASTWYIAQYLEGPNIYTADFDGYNLNFKSDYTVVATKGTTTVTGTWNADLTTKILSSNFTTGTPLNRLNGSWAIYYQDSQGPKMNQFVNGVEWKVTLRIK